MARSRRKPATTATVVVVESSVVAPALSVAATSPAPESPCSPLLQSLVHFADSKLQTGSSTKSQASSTPNLWWRALDTEALREADRFVGLPPDYDIAISGPASCRFVRQESRHWRSFHEGVLSTGCLKEALGMKEQAALRLLGVKNQSADHRALLDVHQHLLQPATAVHSQLLPVALAAGTGACPTTPFSAPVPAVMDPAKQAAQHNAAAMAALHTDMTSDACPPVATKVHAAQAQRHTATGAQSVERSKRCRAAAAGGISSVRCAWGSRQEGSSIHALLQLFPHATVHEVGMCDVSPASIPASWGLAHGSLPPLAASPDGLICHHMFLEASVLQQLQQALSGSFPAAACDPAAMAVQAQPQPQAQQSTGASVMSATAAAASIAQASSTAPVSSGRMTAASQRSVGAASGAVAFGSSNSAVPATASAAAVAASVAVVAGTSELSAAPTTARLSAAIAAAQTAQTAKFARLVPTAVSVPATPPRIPNPPPVTSSPSQTLQTQGEQQASPTQQSAAGVLPVKVASAETAGAQWAAQTAYITDARPPLEVALQQQAAIQRLLQQLLSGVAITVGLGAPDLDPVMDPEVESSGDEKDASCNAACDASQGVDNHVGVSATIDGAIGSSRAATVAWAAAPQVCTAQAWGGEYMETTEARPHMTLPEADFKNAEVSLPVAKSLKRGATEHATKQAAHAAAQSLHGAVLGDAAKHAARAAVLREAAAKLAAAFPPMEGISLPPALTVLPEAAAVVACRLQPAGVCLTQPAAASTPKSAFDSVEDAQSLLKSAPCLSPGKVGIGEGCSSHGENSSGTARRLLGSGNLSLLPPSPHFAAAALSSPSPLALVQRSRHTPSKPGRAAMAACAAALRTINATSTISQHGLQVPKLVAHGSIGAMHQGLRVQGDGDAAVKLSVPGQRWYSTGGAAVRNNTSDSMSNSHVNGDMAAQRQQEQKQQQHQQHQTSSMSHSHMNGVEVVQQQQQQQQQQQTTNSMSHLHMNGDKVAQQQQQQQQQQLVPVVLREVVEVKNSCPFAVRERRTGAKGRIVREFHVSDRGPRDRVDPMWVPQLQLHMLAAGCGSALLVSRSATKGCTVFRMFRDDAYLMQLLQLISRFHTTYVLPRRQPPVNMFASELGYRTFLAHTVRLARGARVVASCGPLPCPPGADDRAMI